MNVCRPTGGYVDSLFPVFSILPLFNKDMPPDYRIAYRPEQRDPRTPLWYKLLYGTMGECAVLCAVVTAGGALYEKQKCLVSEHESYLSANNILGYVALIGGLLWSILGVYMLVQWSWVWMKDVPFATPVQRYGEDIEDLEPGFLAVSSAQSFLSTQAATEATKREVEQAWNDLEKA